MELQGPPAFRGGVGCGLSNRPVKERIRKPSDDVRRGREPPGAKGAVKVFGRANGCERETATRAVGGWGGAPDGPKER